MITRAVLLPQPPLLVPELVTGAAAETEPLRSACVDAARWLTEASRDWLVIAADVNAGTLGVERCGTFRGYGVDVPVALSTTADRAFADPRLPLPALIAGWLRERAGANTARVELVNPLAGVDECAKRGRTIADGSDTALLVLGDGCTTHGASAPSRPDDRAEGFDGEVARALAEADADALLALDPVLAGELGAAGRASWQVLAGVAAAGGEWRGELDYTGAPYGVGYHVARWRRQ